MRFEGTQHNGPLEAGTGSFDVVSVEVNRYEDHRHLTQLVGAPGGGEDGVGQVVGLSQSLYDVGRQVSRGDVRHRKLDGPAEDVANAIDVVADPRDQSRQEFEILPELGIGDFFDEAVFRDIRISSFHRGDILFLGPVLRLDGEADGVAVRPSVSLDAHGPEKKEKLEKNTSLEKSGLFADLIGKRVAMNFLRFVISFKSSVSAGAISPVMR